MVEVPSSRETRRTWVLANGLEAQPFQSTLPTASAVCG